jgi:hypothetical protein
MSNIGVLLVVMGVVMSVVAVCIAVVLVAAARLEAEQDDKQTEYLPAGTPVLVHTVDGAAIKGTVLIAGPEGVAVAGPRYLDGENAREMGGVVRIPTDKVSWTQDLTGVGANGGSS